KAPEIDASFPRRHHTRAPLEWHGMPAPDYAKLCESISQSRRVLKWPRQQFVELARETAGDHYSEGGAKRPVKLNLLSLYDTTMTGLLVANDPRYIITTDDPNLRAQVRIERKWLNEQCVRMNLGETGREVVHQALRDGLLLGRLGNSVRRGEERVG